ncbi:MAG: tRNA-dependent cyclodipeptide synthase [Endomicrobium sp.]|jgi:cyclo(L-tyrosyl-L-tyrosyl) synthase|nr:tRNA-dependent cyclodipeptide synthase [Endomicrobium sp.]
MASFLTETEQSELESCHHSEKDQRMADQMKTVLASDKALNCGDTAETLPRVLVVDGEAVNKMLKTRTEKSSIPLVTSQISNSEQVESDHQLPSISFVNSQSREIFLSREHALLGISPFNSYYSLENLIRLFRWGLTNFKKINVFIPDQISTYTLQAMGYPENKANQKTKAQDRYLMNKTIRALVANNLSEHTAMDTIICLSKLRNSQKYLQFFDAYDKMYINDENFRNGCKMTSKWILKNKEIHEKVSDKFISIAVKYFLAELPLYLNIPDILNISSSLFVYKDLPSKFLYDVYNGCNLFGSLFVLRQGCLAVNFDDKDTAVASHD